MMVVMAPCLRATLPPLPPTDRHRYRDLMRSLAAIAAEEPILRRRAASQALLFGTFTAFWTVIAYELIGEHGLSQAAVGVFALVGAAGAVAAPIAGRLADRVGPRWPIVVGLSLVTAALFQFTRIDTSTTYSDLLPGFTLMGIGIALTMSPMSTAAMNAVAATKAGIASGVLSTFRMVGGTFGVAAIGALFQGQARSNLDHLLSGTVSPSVREDLAHQLGGGGLQPPPGTSPAEAHQIAVAGKTAFIDGLASSMRLSAAVAFAGVIVGLTLINARGQARQPEPEGAQTALAAAAPTGGGAAAARPGT